MAFERRHAPKMKKRKRSGYRILSGKRFTRPLTMERMRLHGLQLKNEADKILTFFLGDK